MRPSWNKYLSGHQKGRTTHVHLALELSKWFRNRKGLPNPHTNLTHGCRLSQRQKALIELGMIMSPDDIPAFAQNLYVCSCLPSLLHSFSGAESDLLTLASRKHPKNKPSSWRSWMLTGPRRRHDAAPTGCGSNKALIFSHILKSNSLLPHCVGLYNLFLSLYYRML